MPPHTKNITKGQKHLYKNPRIRHVIRLMIQGLTLQEIAKRTGYKAITLYQMRRHPSFNDAVGEIEDLLFGEGDRILRTAYNEASSALLFGVKRLKKFLKSGDEDTVFRAIDSLKEIISLERLRPTPFQEEEAAKSRERQASSVNVVNVFDNPRTREAARHFLTAVRDENDVYRTRDDNQP